MDVIEFPRRSADAPAAEPARVPGPERTLWCEGCHGTGVQRTGRCGPCAGYGRRIGAPAVARQP